jgi:hypothetical protein
VADLAQDWSSDVDDTLLEKIALVGEPAEIARQLRQRFGGVFDISTASVFTGDGYSAGGYSAAVGDAIKREFH